MCSVLEHWDMTATKEHLSTLSNLEQSFERLVKNLREPGCPGIDENAVDVCIDRYQNSRHICCWFDRTLGVWEGSRSRFY